MRAALAAMRLLSFEVEGFKNFGRRLLLEDLKPVNIIHGENGVGKSNLLEAIGLFFAIPKMTGGIPSAAEQRRPEERMRTLQMEQVARFRAEEPRDLFDLNEPKPILLAAVLEVEREDFRRAGIAPVPWMGPEDERVEVYLGYWLTLERGVIHCRLEGDHETEKLITESRMRMPKAQQMVVSESVQKMLGNVQGDSGLLEEGQNGGRHEADLIPRMMILTTERLRKTEVKELASELHKLKESRKQRNTQVWTRFVEEMKSFKHILSDGEMQVHKPDEKEAGFSFKPADGREFIPYHLLGTGSHQLICFIGQLLTLRASVVGIEEPEMNLKPANQRVLSEVLRQMAGKPGAPAQIFVTSHSEEFDQGNPFYYMRTSEGSPVIELLAPKMASTVLGRRSSSMEDVVDGAVQCYVSMDGATRIPRGVMERVGIPYGGGVMYLREENGKTVLLSDEAYLRELGYSDEENSSGEA